MLIQKTPPNAVLRQHSEIGELIAPFLEIVDNSVTHIADQDCHGGDSDETPDDKKSATGVRLRGGIPIANSQ